MLLLKRKKGPKTKKKFTCQRRQVKYIQESTVNSIQPQSDTDRRHEFACGKNLPYEDDLRMKHVGSSGMFFGNSEKTIKGELS